MTATNEFSYGDEVQARVIGGPDVTGVLVGLDFAADDSLKAAVVRVGGECYPVDPATVRYAVDKNGFSFSFVGSCLVVRRNDRRLLDPKWVRRKGAKLLRQSLTRG
jgi:hypothetical protein